MNKNKLVSAALTVTTLVWMVGAAVLPVAANAQSTTGIQSQIAALLAQINSLQGQLGTTSTATTPSMSMSYQFNHDLTVGSTGADVNALQQLLISKGFLKIAAPTGFFGAATKAAVIKWQASVGISPMSGYFGPKSRAYINSMAVSTPVTNPVTGPTTTTYPAGCTSSAGFSSTTGLPCTAGTTTSVVAPATGLQVSVASDNPMTGSLISSGSNGGGTAARVAVLAVNLTAGNAGAVTISDMKFHKVGVLADSSVSGAYLVQNGQVVAQYSSLNQGVIDFSGLQLSVPAGQTLDLQLAIDPAGGLSAGNTVGFSMNAATDVTAFDASNNAITPTGVFPITGNTFTVTTVSNPQLASVSVASTSIANSVTAGTQNNIVGGWNFSVQNNLVWLKGISFHVIGSANKGDLRNVKLMINGTQVGPTLATVPATGIAYFNAMATPGTLNTGSNNVQLFADVMGSPSYNFQFEILNSYDILAVDSQYNVPIAITNGGGTGTLVSIQQGTITMSQDASTPTGNVAVGQSGVTLGKFDIYAGGEAVKVKWIDFTLAFTGASTSAKVSDQVRNIALTDDAGGQVGTTINTPPSGNACSDSGQAGNVTNSGAGNETFTTASPTYEDCFGTNTSNINYIVPANTTRVLSLKADVQSGAKFSTVTASLLAESGNLQGLTSSQTGSSSGAAGSALSLASTLLTVAQNNALATPVNVTPNSSHVKIGSYNFQASSASGVQVNTLTVTMGASSQSTFQNLGVWVNGTQFGTTQGVVGSAGVYSFSGSPFTVPAGSSVNVDVYADILSGGVSTPLATTLSGCSATGVTSYNAISCSSVGGQNVTLAGAAAVTVSADGSQPSAGQIVMGSTGNTLGIFRFTETSNAENVKITQLPIYDVVSSAAANAAFTNLTLWNGSTELGSVGSAGASSTINGSTTYTYSFQIQGNPIVVPKANSISITLKGDASPYSVGASDNVMNTFKIGTTTNLTALGQSSNVASAVTLSGASGNSQTVLRTVLTPSVNNSSADGSYFVPSNHQSRNTSDDLAEIKLAANNSGGAIAHVLTVTFSGSLASSSNFLSGVQLLDSNGTSIVTDGATATTSAACTGSTSCTVTWTIPTSTVQAQISAGGTGLFKLRINDQFGQSAVANTSMSLSANIQNAGDVQYYDSLDSSANLIASIPTNLVPMTVASFALPLGN